MTEAPTFENVEDANKYIASNHKVEPETPPEPAFDEAKVTELVNARLAEQSKTLVNEHESRNINVFLGDEDNVAAIKKTFTGDKADADYEAWRKEVQEGKASFRELELLQARGSKVLAAEQKAADEKAKAAASGVGVPAYPGSGQGETLAPVDAALKMQEIIDDPKRSIVNSACSDDQRKKDQAELKHLSQFLDDTAETGYQKTRWNIAQYHRDTANNGGQGYRPQPLPVV